MITDSAIQQRRSPQSLRDFVVELKDAVEADTAERHRGILKTGLYKEFLDEIVPLSLFALQAYPGNYGIQPVLGNQGHDALVFNETGDEVDRIEMTSPHDGAIAAKDNRLVVERGHGEVHIGNHDDTLEDLSGPLFPWVLATCRKKAEKDYRDCTLVVGIEPIWPDAENEKTQYERQIQKLASEMAAIKFNAKRVFLLVMSPVRVVLVQG